MDIAGSLAQGLHEDFVRHGHRWRGVRRRHGCSQVRVPGMVVLPSGVARLAQVTRLIHRLLHMGQATSMEKLLLQVL